MFRYLTPLLMATALAACSTTESDRSGEPDQADRGSVGKADAFGSCQSPDGDLCGGAGSGNCWCDELCVDYGDCCSDAAAVCEIDDAGDGCEPELCEIACANGFATDEDGCEICECQGQFCGGIAAIQCPPGHTCESEADFPDAGGICEPAPFCGGFAGIQCADGLICVDVPGDGCDPPQGADCGGMCVPAPTSCDASDCGPAPGAPTIECWDGSTAGPVCDLTDDGSCGWTIVQCPDAPAGPTCAGACGGAASGGQCWCDDLCSNYGDCCDDYEAECVDAGPDCGDEECQSGEACVITVMQTGLVHTCAEIPAGCEDGDPSCACMGDEVCTGAFDLCSDAPDALSCHCPNC